jgi:hypothetical protein
MSENISLFESATRKKFRFASPRGELTVEQLWDVPLLSSDGLNLDSIAKAVNKDLKAATEESFVATGRSPAHGVIEAKLNIVKRVIEVKLNEQAEAKKRAENKAKRDKLIGALAAKQDGKFEKMSEKQLFAELDALDD